MSQTPALGGDGVILRPLLLEDAAALFLALGDAEVQRFRAQPIHANVAETQRYILETLQRSAAAWAITQDGGQALGRLALRVDGDEGEFGIVIRAAAHRRGLGLNALGLALTYAFEDLGLRRLRANIDSENAPSLALFARAGFVETARLPKNRLTKLGVRDTIVMGKRNSAFGD
jgi:RimJ/RimL family protein N-acetyltransferase